MKDANERLLDMLAAFETGATAGDYDVPEIDNISELYQAAGQKEMTDEEVKTFLVEKLHPFLCKGK